MYILCKMKQTVRGVLAVFSGIILILTGTSCASDEADSAITAGHLDETTHDNYPIPGNERPIESPCVSDYECPVVGQEEVTLL